MGKSLKGKELGTGISQRKDGRYQARYTDRFGKRQYIYDTDLKELRKKLRAEQVANDKGTSVIDSSITLNEWFDTYLELYKANCRNSTKHTYTVDYNRVRKNLGEMKLSDIKLVSVQQAINMIVSITSQKSTLAILNSVLDKAVDSEILVVNPAKKVSVSKREKKKERRVLTEKETELLLKEIKKSSSQLIVVVALRTGMRIGEVLGLTWDDLDFKNKIIHVRKTLCIVSENGKTHFEFHDTKTDSGARDIPMLEDVCKVFKQQYEYKQSILKSGKNPVPGFENLVFITRKNKPIDVSTVRRALIQAGKRINEEYPDCKFKEVHPHALRHTFATRCIENGMNPKTLQKILGHSTLNMTMDLYCHVMQETINSEMQKMEKLSVSL